MRVRFDFFNIQSPMMWIRMNNMRGTKAEPQRWLNRSLSNVISNLAGKECTKTGLWLFLLLKC